MRGIKLTGASTPPEQSDEVLAMEELYNRVMQVLMQNGFVPVEDECPAQCNPQEKP